MEELVPRLARVEERLHRLLAGGLRSAGPDAAELAAEAVHLEAAGLPELAARLRTAAQAAATGAAAPADALGAIVLAAAHCRLLRARLGTDSPPPGAWQTLGPSRRKEGAAPDRLLPVGRLALETGEAWACIRLRGSVPDSLILLTPPPLEPDPAPWLTRCLEGRLRWHGRYPLGAAGEVQACTLGDAAWSEPESENPREPLLDALQSGKLKPGMNLWRHGGPVEARQLSPDDLDSAVWPDAASRTAVREGLREPAWALLWVEGALHTPLCLLQPGGLFRKARLLHLVSGLPAEPLHR